MAVKVVTSLCGAEHRHAIVQAADQLIKQHVVSDGAPYDETDVVAGDVEEGAVVAAVVDRAVAVT